MTGIDRGAGRVGLRVVQRYLPAQPEIPEVQSRDSTSTTTPPAAGRHRPSGLRSSVDRGEFAVFLGVSDRMVSKWEAGTTPRQVNQSTLDMALKRADPQVTDRFVRFAHWPAQTRPRAEDGRGEAGWVVHLLVDVPDLSGALALADAICASLADAHPQVIAGATTVSPADHQSAQHPVYCDRRLPGQGRCGLPHGHRDDCAP